MHFKRGRDRFVVAFPEAHIVIKFPLIKVYQCWKLLIKILNTKGGLVEIYTHLTQAISTGIGFPAMLIGGIAANWSEYVFWLKHKHPFVQDTYFSLFGLFSVQRMDMECNLEQREFNFKLSEIITYSYASYDSHTFSNPKNFSIRNGKLCLHDYASKRAQQVLELQRKAIAKKLKTVQ
jgi:hypothetical protein